MAIPITAVTTAAEGAYRARDGKGDSALVEELTQSCGGELEKGVLTARHRGAEFRLRFLPQQRFELSLPCPLAGRFRVTRKGCLDRRMQEFVPARKFHSHDSRFDHDFSVQTRDPELTSAILTRQPNRAAVRNLFERGALVVHLDGERVQVIGTRKSLGPQPTVNDILWLVEQVATIAASVRRFARRHERRPAAKVDAIVVAAWVLLALLGVLGLVLVVAGSSEFTLVRPGAFLPYVLAGFLPVPALVFALAIANQGRTAPYGLLRGLAAAALVVTPLFLSGALLFSNGLMDGSPAQHHDVAVIEKRARKNDDGDPKYYACLEAWWAAGDVRWLLVSKKTYDALSAGESRGQVVTRAGLLGLEWIEDYTVQP